MLTFLETQSSTIHYSMDEKSNYVHLYIYKIIHISNHAKLFVTLCCAPRKWNNEYQHLRNLDEDNVDLFGQSKSRLEELSRVKISVKTQTATKIIRSARVSFSTQLANLGKSQMH